MTAQDEMTRERTQDEPHTEPKPKSRRVNLSELFDVIDDLWSYLERNESRDRYFGKCTGVQKEEFDSVRKRLAEMRELLHGKPTDDRTNQG